MSTDDELYQCIGICMVDDTSGLCMGCGRPVHKPAGAPEPAADDNADGPTMAEQ